MRRRLRRLRDCCHYRTRVLPLECLRSVYAQTRDLSLEVFVVGSASADGCAETLAADFPPIRFSSLHDGLGCAA